MADAVEWAELMNAALRQRSTVILGAATAADEATPLGFAATYAPDGDIIITVTPAGTLADVHDLSLRIARACLNDDQCVTFKRIGEDS